MQLQHFDLLRSRFLSLVDVRIHPERIEVGWVYAEPGLASVEIVRSQNDQEIAIQIPDNLQRLQNWQVFCLPHESIEFLRAT